MLTANWTSIAKMPTAIVAAPMPAMMNQICSEGSSKWFTRRVAPISPRMYSGVNATQKPTSQNQNEHLPQNSSSL